MRLLSVNVSQPKAVPFGGKIITTGIFKQPVEGRVRLRTLNLDGDGQADRAIHVPERGAHVRSDPLSGCERNSDAVRGRGRTRYRA